MTDAEILDMALRFLDNASISRSFDRQSKTESFRAFRDKLDMNAYDVAGERHLFIGDVEIKNVSVTAKVFEAMKKKWLAGAETDDQRLMRFRNAAFGTILTKTNVLENERGERTRE